VTSKAEAARLRTDENHPTLRAVQAILVRNPELRRYHLINNWGLSSRTIDAWISRGFIKLKETTRIDNTMSWLRTRRRNRSSSTTSTESSTTPEKS